MNNFLQDLYQEVVIDHSRSPRNFKRLESYTHDGEGHNPLCGDEIHLYLVVNNGVIQNYGFQGCGCAISRASASLMGEAVLGQNVQDALALNRAFRRVLTENSNDEIGKLEVLKGVRAFPMRVKCATLAWHTLEAALCKHQEIVTTE